MPNALSLALPPRRLAPIQLTRKRPRTTPLLHVPRTTHLLHRGRRGTHTGAGRSETALLRILAPVHRLRVRRRHLANRALRLRRRCPDIGLRVCDAEGCHAGVLLLLHGWGVVLRRGSWVGRCWLRLRLGGVDGGCGRGGGGLGLLLAAEEEEDQDGEEGEADEGTDYCAGDPGFAFGFLLLVCGGGGGGDVGGCGGVRAVIGGACGCCGGAAS